MAYSLQYYPVEYSSAHDKCFYSVYENVKAIDPATYAGYKYIAYVWINGVLISKQEAFPNPVTKRGDFNFGTIIRNFVSNEFAPNLSGLKGGNEFGNSSLWCGVVVKFGEFYSGTEYTNILVDSERKFYNHYNGQLLGNETILGNYVNKAATTRPHENETRLQTRWQLFPYFALSAASFDVVVKTYTNNILINTLTKTITPTSGNCLYHLNVSPVAINEETANTVTSSTDYYTVKIGTTSEFKFIIKNECVYKPVTVCFLNKFGGFETFEFIKASVKTNEVERKSYGVLDYDNAGNSFSGNMVYSNVKTYDVGFKSKMLINSNNVKEECYKWLFEAISSPVVYEVIDTDNRNLFLECEIEETTHVFKNKLNDNIFNFSLTLLYNSTKKTQYQ